MKTIAHSLVLRDLTTRLAAVTPESQRRWGTLTAQEMLCHLGDAAEMVLLVRPRDRPVLQRQRSIVRLLGLWTPFRWPHGWRTNPLHDPRLAGTRPSVFAADLQRAITSLEGLAVARPDSLEPAHGFFGTMSVLDWQRWAYKHTDHHLRQFGV